MAPQGSLPPTLCHQPLTPALPLSLCFSTLPAPFFLSHLELKSWERLDRHLSGPESGETTVSESSNRSGPWRGLFVLLSTSHSLGSADSGHLHEGDLETPFVRRGGDLSD